MCNCVRYLASRFTLSQVGELVAKLVRGTQRIAGPFSGLTVHLEALLPMKGEQSLAPSLYDANTRVRSRMLSNEVAPNS